MKINFDIDYENGETEKVTAHPRSMVAFEKTHRRSLGDDPDISALMWLAWHASGSPAGSFEEWLEKVDDVTPHGDDDDEEESPPKQSEGASFGM